MTLHKTPGTEFVVPHHSALARMLGFDETVMSSPSAPPPLPSAEALLPRGLFEAMVNASEYTHPSLCGRNIGLTPSATVVAPPKETADGPYSYRKEADNVVDMDLGFDTIYVYTDVVEFRIAGAILAPLLRSLPVGGSHSATVYDRFTNIHYVPLLYAHLKSIEINIETLLSYGTDVKVTQLTSHLWNKDTATRTDAVEIVKGPAANEGLVARRANIVRSRLVDLMGRLHLDLFLQDKFLINGVDVKIRLVRSKSAFALIVGGINPDYRIDIVNATLFAKKATLNPTVQMAHIKALEKSTVRYPMRSVDCKVYSILAGTRSHTYENLFLGTLPKRLVLCCIDNDAYNGVYTKNPFHAQNNAISFHAVYVDGRQIPSKLFQPNFEDDLFVRSYMSLFSSTDKLVAGRGERTDLQRLPTRLHLLWF